MTQQHPAGWYSQPDGTQRYWDGHQWTTTTPTAGTAQTPTPPAAPQPAATGLDPRKPWFKRKRVIVPAVALVGIIAIATTQGGGANQTALPTTSAAPTATSSAPATATPDATPDPAESATTEPAEEPTQAEVATLGNGDHIVGVDIEPGVYRAEVDMGLIQLCTVSQSKEDGDIMDIRNANEGSVIFSVEKKKGSVVSFSGCGLIALAGDVLRKNPEEITNGYWLVRSELKAGKYQGVVDTDSPIQLGTIIQTNADGDVMDLRNANEGKVVFTVKDKKGSVVSFSGFTEIKKVG